MASPFKIFRKNQKLWIAGLTLLTMFGFIFLPTILDTMGNMSGNNPLAFESKYGSMDEIELNGLRERHQRIVGVLTEILERAGVSASNAGQFLEYKLGGSTPEDVAVSWLLAQSANARGMIVGDDMIISFLKRLSQNQIDIGVFKKSIERSGMTERMFMEVMREEISSMLMREMFYPSVFAATPGQRWDYFCRLKRLATIEAASVPVADYIAQIKDPPEEELKSFYERHKDTIAFPHSPEPGFKKPQRIALEYFKAETDKFIAPELISDEEVLRRYEKDREQYDKLYPSTPLEKPAADGEKKPALERPKDAGKPGADAKEPVKEEPKTEQTPVPATVPAEPKTEPTPPKTEPTPPKTESKEPAAKKADGALLGGESPFRPAAFQQPEPEAKTTPEPAAKPEPAPEKPQPAAKPAEKPEEKPADAAKTPAAKPEEKPADAKANPPKVAEQPAAGPSDRVKEYIRRQIAGEKINVIFERLGKEMDEYREKKNEYDYSPTAKKAGKAPPERPDFDRLAKENGLAVGRIGPVANWEAAKSEIGSAYMGNGLRAWQYAFRAMAKLRPESAVDLSGNAYLLWKTEDAKEETPKFEDPGVREEVLRQWKMTQARELAQKEAETLADEARKAGKSLKEVFAGRSKPIVMTPPPFSWMTLGNVAMRFDQRPEISEVEGIDFAGEEFMQAVFKLTPGQLAATMNAPKTAAYVVRLIDYTPPYKVIFEQFKVDDYRTYASFAQNDYARMYQAWIKEIQTDAGFKWTKEHEERMKNISQESPSESGN